MPYKVQFVGLVCFYRERGARQVLLPDGRSPGPGIDPHFPLIIVAPKAVKSAAGWPADEDTRRGIYALPACWLSIEGADAPGSLDVSKHDGILPQLRQIDPGFEIDPDRAETVVRLYLRQGTLSAHEVPGGTAVMSQLQVPHEGTITITVTPRDGSPNRTLLLEPGSEILLGNMAEGGVYKPETHVGGHFKIYEKLSIRPVNLREPEAVSTLEKPSSDHWYFRRALPISLSMSCSNTGCC